MSKYRVEVEADTTIRFDAFVEADSPAEARRIAEDAEPGEIEEYPEHPNDIGMLSHIKARSAHEWEAK